MRNLALSYWEHQSFFGSAEVVIIGAGLVGLTAALYLKQRRPNWHVVVLERRALPSGASTRNAGFACLGSISEPLPDISLPGTFHYDHGYAYFRQLPDYRILLGGGRNLDFAA